MRQNLQGFFMKFQTDLNAKAMSKVERHFIFYRILLVALALFSPIWGARASTTSWNRTTAGKWSDSGNWNGGLPTFSSTATVNSGTAGLAAGYSGSFGTLRMGTSSSRTGSINLTGGLLSGGNAYLGYATGGIGVVTLSSGTWSETGLLTVGQAGQGTLNISGGLVTSWGGVLGAASGGAGSVTLTGGTWNDIGDLSVGAIGKGALSVSSAYLRSGSATIGSGASGGSATLTSGTWSSFGDVLIGNLTTGTLAMTNSSFSNENAAVGEAAGSKGLATVAGGSWTSSNLLVVGDYGTGTMTASNSSVSSAYALIGNQSGGIGTALVTGGTWSSNSSLTVGGLGKGTFTASNAYLYTGSTTVGSSASGGTLTVAGSTWNNPGDVVVGTGTLAITNSVVTSNNGGIGEQTGGAGTASVVNSSWTSTNILAVGDTGTGSMTVKNSHIYSQYAVIGNHDGGVGTVTVTSGTWENLYGMYVGFNPGSTGSFKLNGGLVDVGPNGSPDSTFIAENAGSKGTVTVNSGTWRTTQVLYVGDSGTGSMTVNNGYIVDQIAEVGASGVGTMTFNSGTWTNSGDIRVGVHGQGTLNARGGYISSQAATIGYYVGSQGLATVNSTTWAIDSSLAVGLSGTGALTISGSSILTVGNSVSIGGDVGGTVTLDHSYLSTNSTTVGTTKGASASLTVASGTWDNALGLTIGTDGAGTVTVNSGGKVTGPFLTIGSDIYNSTAGGGALLVNGGTVFSNTTAFDQQAGSKATISVTGGLWKNDLDVDLGIQGTGILNVSGSGVVTIGNGGGVLTLASGTGSTGTLNLGPGGTLNVGLIQSGSGAATVNFNQTGTAVMATPLLGTFALVKSGTGTMILTGNSVTAGSVKISGGTLQLGNGGTTGYLTTDIVDNGTLAFKRSDAVYFGNVISGTGKLQQIGSSVLALTANNTYTGGTLISSGTLWLGLGGTAGMIAGNVTDNGTLAFYRSNSTSFSGVISGTGKVVQLGPKLVALTGNNTYTGGTTVASGTLQLGNSGTSGSLAGNVVDNGTLAFKRTNWLSLRGVISGTGSVIQLGSGTVALAGNNSYTGGTTISAGTLQLGNSGTTGSVAGNVVDNGKLAFKRTNWLSLSGVISGTGSVVQLGSGTVALAADNTYTGGTTISAGTLQLGNNGTRGSVAGNVADNGTLAFKRTNLLSFGGVISGTGSVVQLGSGTVTLRGANTYSGGTMISAGTMMVGNSQALGTGEVTLAAGKLATDGSVGRITVNGDLLWNTSGKIALTLTADSSTSEYVSIKGGLEGTGTLTFAFTPENLPAGENSFRVLTVAGGFGSIGADDFAFTSSDPGLEGSFRIDGTHLWFDDGYAPGAGSGAEGGSMVLGAVPEPADIALLALGAAFLLGVGFRRRRPSSSAINR